MFSHSDSSSDSSVIISNSYSHLRATEPRWHQRPHERRCLFTVVIFTFVLPKMFVGLLENQPISEADVISFNNAVFIVVFVRHIQNWAAWDRLLCSESLLIRLAESNQGSGWQGQSKWTQSLSSVWYVGVPSRWSAVEARSTVEVRSAFAFRGMSFRSMWRSRV